jgi:glycosyltransferase involved in cell wall biosynthesis
VTSLSVIVPTRNRAGLWADGWLLDSLRAQAEPPDELIIALDHTEDITLELITADLKLDPVPFPVRILEVLAPRAQPMPASGIPDNCLFHAAAGEILVHVDDDIALPPDFIWKIRWLLEALPPAVIWPNTAFVTKDKSPLPGHDGRDCRPWLASKQHWPLRPGGLLEMPLNMQVHWGAVYCLCARDLRRIGGHNLEHCGWHNTDTRLGNRLVRSGVSSYLTATPDMSPLHLGKTWYAQHAHEPLAIKYSQGTSLGPRFANGGQAFWSSSWFESAYRELPRIDAGKSTATIT